MNSKISFWSQVKMTLKYELMNQQMFIKYFLLSLIIGNGVLLLIIAINLDVLVSQFFALYLVYMLLFMMLYYILSNKYEYKQIRQLMYYKFNLNMVFNIKFLIVLLMALLNTATIGLIAVTSTWLKMKLDFSIGVFAHLFITPFIFTYLLFVIWYQTYHSNKYRVTNKVLSYTMALLSTGYMLFIFVVVFVVLFITFVFRVPFLEIISDILHVLIDFPIQSFLALAIIAYYQIQFIRLNKDGIEA